LNSPWKAAADTDSGVSGEGIDHREWRQQVPFLNVNEHLGDLQLAIFLFGSKIRERLHPKLLVTLSMLFARLDTFWGGFQWRGCWLLCPCFLHGYVLGRVLVEGGVCVVHAIR
jgi:hypothetical protein